MLDSPYVRRVAVSLQLLGLRFEHRPVPLFRSFDEFSRINPMVKAPTLVCDDGQVLMDSTLILALAEAMARPRSLMPTPLRERQHALRLIGLALAACEKSGQLVYERGLRPPQKRHAPWVTRVTAQLLAAYREIEAELARAMPDASRSGITQAGVSLAVAWRFTQQTLPEVVPASSFPRLVEFCALVEALPEFRAAPHGEDAMQPLADAPAGRTSAYVPPGFGSVTPYFFVDGAERFVAFLVAGLGGREVLRSLRADGRIANVQVTLDRSTVMVSEASLAYPAMTGSYYLYVVDARATMRSALAQGATLEMAVADMPYGDRQGGVPDPHGNLWWISERIVHAPYAD